MPKLIVRAEALRHNLAAVVDACERAGSACLFAFKEAALHPELTAAILAGNRTVRLGVVAWPHASFDSLPPLERHHIYSPSPMLMSKAASCSTVYLSSRFSLDQLAARCGTHRPDIRLTLECGDGRDGIHEEEAETMAKATCAAGFRLRGLSVNFACLSTAPPTLEALRRAEQVLERIRPFAPDTDISAGGTDMLELAETCVLPPSVREIRCGTGVMLGVYPLSGQALPLARQDTFLLEACVLERRWKEGRLLALFDFGSFHTAPEYLIAPWTGCRYCGASSAYTVFDVTDCKPAAKERIKEGAVVSFSLRYQALSRALLSLALPMDIEGHDIEVSHV